MKSFLQEIESRFEELNEKIDLDVIIQDLNNETKLTTDTFSLGNSDKTLSQSFLLNPRPPESWEKYVREENPELKADELQSVWFEFRKLVKEKPQRWQDSDGDGTWYEPGEDVNEADVVVTDPTKLKAVRAELEPDDRLVVEDELEEISAAAGVPGYQTPNAFSTPAQAKKKKNMKYESVQKAMDIKYEALIESYSKFALGKGPKTSPANTVNTTIKEVAKKLKEMETIVNYTTKLKNESGMTRAEYGKSTQTALNKISERLLKISERIRSLGE